MLLRVGITVALAIWDVEAGSCVVIVLEFCHEPHLLFDSNAFTQQVLSLSKPLHDLLANFHLYSLLIFALLFFGQAPTLKFILEHIFTPFTFLEYFVKFLNINRVDLLILKLFDLVLDFFIEGHGFHILKDLLKSKIFVRIGLDHISNILCIFWLDFLEEAGLIKHPFDSTKTLIHIKISILFPVTGLYELLWLGNYALDSCFCGIARFNNKFFSHKLVHIPILQKVTFMMRDEDLFLKFCLFFERLKLCLFLGFEEFQSLDFLL